MTNKRKNKDFNPYNCPVTHFMNLIGGKWKILIVYAISKGYNRFSLLKEAIPVISKQMLINQLQELVDDAILDRITYNEAPRKVEYIITDYGKSVMKVIETIQDWGIEDLKKRVAENS